MLKICPPYHNVSANRLLFRIIVFTRFVARGLNILNLLELSQTITGVSFSQSAIATRGGFRGGPGGQDPAAPQTS